jgi:hypothetical protein
MRFVSNVVLLNVASLGSLSVGLFQIESASLKWQRWKSFARMQMGCPSAFSIAKSAWRVWVRWLRLGWEKLNRNIFNELRQELFNSVDAILINRRLRPPPPPSRLSRRALLEILLFGIDPHRPYNRDIFNCTNYDILYRLADSLGIDESLCSIGNSVLSHCWLHHQLAHTTKYVHCTTCLINVIIL